MRAVFEQSGWIRLKRKKAKENPGKHRLVFLQKSLNTQRPIKLKLEVRRFLSRLYQFVIGDSSDFIRLMNENRFINALDNYKITSLLFLNMFVQMCFASWSSKCKKSSFFCFSV